MIDKVTGNRLGADVCQNTIDALITIRDYHHTIPKNNTEFSEKDYRSYRNNTMPLRGYIGYALSYGSKWFGGWARTDATGKIQRDYVAEAYRNATKQSPKLQGCRLECMSYNDLCLPPNSIIYCDPPYAGTTGYKRPFDHTAFWQWCRDKATEGHTMYVSEYKAPPDFLCLWAGQIKSSLTKDTGSKTRTEKLFTKKDKEL